MFDIQINGIKYVKDLPEPAGAMVITLLQARIAMDRLQTFQKSVSEPLHQYHHHQTLYVHQ
jgi:hypothetical protein